MIPGVGLLVLVFLLTLMVIAWWPKQYKIKVGGGFANGMPFETFRTRSYWPRRMAIAVCRRFRKEKAVRKLARGLHEVRVVK